MLGPPPPCSSPATGLAGWQLPGSGGASRCSARRLRSFRSSARTGRRRGLLSERSPSCPRWHP
eukprot:6400722-Alexandrium_andersonii.AAC.1